MVINFGEKMEIKEYNGEDYCPMFSYGGWRVAVANFCERLKEENLCRLERHLNTEEVFVLLQGEATLYIGKIMKAYPMEIGKLYNVHCGEWHCISMKMGARVVIVENDDTNDKNTERFYFRET